MMTNIVEQAAEAFNQPIIAGDKRYIKAGITPLYIKSVTHFLSYLTAHGHIDLDNPQTFLPEFGESRFHLTTEDLKLVYGLGVAMGATQR